MATETVKTSWLRDYDGNKFSPKTSTQSLVGVLDIEHGGTGNGVIYTDYVRALNSEVYPINYSGQDIIHIGGYVLQDSYIRVCSSSSEARSASRALYQNLVQQIESMSISPDQVIYEMGLEPPYSQASTWSANPNDIKSLTQEPLGYGGYDNAYVAYSEPVTDSNGNVISWEDYYQIEAEVQWGGDLQVNIEYKSSYSYYYLQILNPIANNSIFYFTLKQSDYNTSRGFIINGKKYEDCIYDKNGQLLPTATAFNQDNILIQCLLQDNRIYFLNFDLNIKSKNDIQINNRYVMETIDTNFNEIVNGYDIKYECELFDNGSNIYLILPSIFSSSNRFHNHSELYIDGVLVPNSLDNYTISGSTVYLHCLSNGNHTAEIVLKGMPLTEANTMMRGHYF